ncbi:MAG: tRNA (adenosine(37)-N6)-threonylcarbamoyltransferase complex dimerization subunit type 1 TsaB [Candidatus Omnitrophota bacterium]
MRVLAIDTSSKVLGAAILDDEGREVEFRYDFELRHTSHLAPMIEDILEFASLKFADIDAYCVSIGPGSFTGLRIGVATVKALAAVDGKSVIGVPTLDVLAAGIEVFSGAVGVIIDAKKERFYAAFYTAKGDLLKKRSKDLLIDSGRLLQKIADHEEIVLLGDGIDKLRTQGLIPGKATGGGVRIARREFWYPRPINVARLGLAMLKKGEVAQDVERLTPVYLHPLNVQCKKPQRSA